MGNGGFQIPEDITPEEEGILAEAAASAFDLDPHPGDDGDDDADEGDDEDGTDEDD